MEADEKIKRVDIEERQSSLLSPSPSLFPTIIFDIVCYFCGIFITNREVVPDFRDDPHYCVVLFKQQVLLRVDTPRWRCTPEEIQRKATELNVPVVLLIMQ